jgi:hypothetical protein
MDQKLLSSLQGTWDHFRQLKYDDAVQSFDIEDSKISCAVGGCQKMDWEAEGEIIKITESAILIEWTKAVQNDGKQFLDKPVEIKIAFPEITKNLSLPKGPYDEDYSAFYDQMASFERDPAELNFRSPTKCIYYHWVSDE